jgi:hypothetical protein
VSPALVEVELAAEKADQQKDCMIADSITNSSQFCDNFLTILNDYLRYRAQRQTVEAAQMLVPVA